MTQNIIQKITDEMSQKAEQLNMLGEDVSLIMEEIRRINRNVMTQDLPEIPVLQPISRPLAELNMDEMDREYLQNMQEEESYV